MNTKVKGESYVSHPVVSLRLAIDRWLKYGVSTSLGLIATTFGALALTLILFFAIAGLNFSSSTDSPAFDAEKLLPLIPLFFIGALLIIFAILLPLTIALDYVFVNAQNNLKTAYRAALKRGYKRLFVAVGAYVLATAFVIGGLILLVLPGIYIALRLAYLNSVIANEDLGPVESLKRSLEFTNKNVWDIVGVLSLTIVISSVISLMTTGFEAMAPQNSYASAVSTLLAVISIAVGLFVAQGIYFRYHQSALEKGSQLTKEGTDPMNYWLLIGATVAFFIDGATTNDLEPLENFNFEDNQGSV